jgi:hypothetical protein
LTIVEICVALLLGVMVLGLVVGLLRSAVVTAGRAEERLDPRERAHLALAVVRGALMDSWHFRADSAGCRLAFHGPCRDGEVWFDRERRRLRFRPPGADRPYDLVPSGVADFGASVVGPGYLRIMLEIERTGRGGPLASLAPLKVVDEVFVPCVGLRDRSIPWSRALEHRKALEPSS